MTPSLYMHSLQLENFRGFQELSLQLHPRLNVFLGNNGAGKSSILHALEVALACIVDEFGQNSAVKVNMSYDDIYNGAAHSNIIVTMYDGYDISWRLLATPTLNEGKKGSKTHTNTPDIVNYISKLKQYILYPQNKQNLPVFISYQSTRKLNDYIPQNENMADFSSRACYDDAISVNNSSGTILKWFKDKEDLENETKVKSQNLQYVDPQLQVIRNAMLHSLGFASFTFNRTHWTFSLKKNDQELYYNQLSDGEKGYLLLVADIARRLAIANPHSDNPLNGRGIVIIDEIELHLHPKWQRQIISQLMNTFTCCQFIISTHSPQVIGEVKPESLWILEEGVAPYHPERSYGMESSDLLREVMDAPSANTGVTSDLLEIEKLMDTEDYDKAREKIAELAKKAKNIPALIGLNALLTMEGQEQADLEG